VSLNIYVKKKEKLGISPLNRRLDAQAAQKSNTKGIELYRKSGNNLSRYHCTLTLFSQVF
jgi:hypothetical protein